MSTSVLFDQPGPKGKRRQFIGGVVGVVIVVAIIGFFLWRMAATEQFAEEKWSIFVNPNTLTVLMNAFVNTLLAAILAILGALIFGAIFGAMRVSTVKPLRWIATIVVEFFRAVPLVLLILFVFLGFAEDLQALAENLGITAVMDSMGLGRSQGAFASLVIGLTLYNGSVLAEIFRAGVQSVPKGQREAAMAVGLTSGQTLRMILAPQAIRIMLPAIISQSVVALKDTSLGLIVAYAELVQTGRLIAVGYNNYLPMAIIIGTVFILINYSLSKFANYLSARQRRTKKLAPIKADPNLPPEAMIDLVDDRQRKE